MAVITVPAKKLRRNVWIKIFFGGLGFFILSLLTMVFTNNPNLFPTVVLLGNLMVPVTYVAFFYERRHLSRLDTPIASTVFFYGGLLGVLASAILEPFLVRATDPFSVLIIGVIEEGAKILGVILLARRRRPVSEIDGLILGAAAGMGFAALESMGYTFTEFLVSQGSLSATVWIMLLRGILSPLGHGTWTAILASFVYQETTGGRFGKAWRIILGYLVVVVLHALWDWLPPLVGQFFNSNLAVIISQVSVGVIGFIILWLRWRRARHFQDKKMDQDLLAKPADTPEVVNLPS